MKFLVPLLFVLAAVSSRYIHGKDVNVAEDGTIIIRCENGKQMMISQQVGPHGQQVMEIEINGPRMMSKKIQINDDNEVKVLQTMGDNFIIGNLKMVPMMNVDKMEQSKKATSQIDMLVEIMKEHQGTLDEQSFEKLMDKIRKAVQRGMLSSTILDHLQAISQDKPMIGLEEDLTSMNHAMKPTMWNMDKSDKWMTTGQMGQNLWNQWRQTEQQHKMENMLEDDMDAMMPITNLEHMKPTMRNMGQSDKWMTTGKMGQNLWNQWGQTEQQHKMENMLDEDMDVRMIEHMMQMRGFTHMDIKMMFVNGFTPMDMKMMMMRGVTPRDMKMMLMKGLTCKDIRAMLMMHSIPMKMQMMRMMRAGPMDMKMMQMMHGNPMDMQMMRMMRVNPMHMQMMGIKNTPMVQNLPWVQHSLEMSPIMSHRSPMFTDDMLSSDDMTTRDTMMGNWGNTRQQLPVHQGWNERMMF